MTAHTIRITGSETRIETKTTDLRFADRNGRKVLQQLVNITSETGFAQEWRDVPLVVEGK